MTRIKRICADYTLNKSSKNTQYWPARCPLNFPKGRLTRYNSQLVFSKIKCEQVYFSLKGVFLEALNTQKVIGNTDHFKQKASTYCRTKEIKANTVTSIIKN